MDIKRYVALLRGINISGKNKVPMSELKKEFEKQGMFHSGRRLRSTSSSDNAGVPADPADEVRQLRNEVEYLRQEVEFLKKIPPVRLQYG